MISKQTVYLTADRSKAVKEGDPAAQYLLVRKGHDIEEATVEKYNASNLVGDGKAEPASQPAEESAPVIQNREDALPKMRKRAAKPKK